MPGFAGDGGLATNASLNNPIAVAVDGAGSLYIVDQQNNRIRKVANGQITTVAGAGREEVSMGSATAVLPPTPF